MVSASEVARLRKNPRSGRDGADLEMLCTDFEDRLTDYIDGALASDEQRAFSEHALRCPVCHELLNEVRNAIVECRSDVPPQPTPGLEARILLATAPETSMTCAEFEQY